MSLLWNVIGFVFFSLVCAGNTLSEIIPPNIRKISFHKIKLWRRLSVCIKVGDIASVIK